jgi:hypothetical protein
MSTVLRDACIHSSPPIWCNLVKSSCVMETVHQTIYCQFVWHRRTGKCIPKPILATKSRNEMPRSVRQWTLIALVKKTSSHFNCLKTTDGLAQAGYDLRGFLYSHSDIVCLLIQSNFTELQPSINILIWVAWIFDHPVFTVSAIRSFFFPGAESSQEADSHSATRVTWRFITTFTTANHQSLFWARWNQSTPSHYFFTL